VLPPVADTIRGARAGRESPRAAVATLTSHPRPTSSRPQAPTSACWMTQLQPASPEVPLRECPLTSDPVKGKTGRCGPYLDGHPLGATEPSLPPADQL